MRRDGGPARPVTFAVLGELLCFAVGGVNRKRDARLARLDDIARDPRVALLVDHYDADWSALWWVEIDGDRQRAPVDCASVRLTVGRSTRPTAPRAPRGQSS